MLTNKYEYDNSYKYEPKRTRNKNEEACPMTEEKKTNTYKKPEVEVIKLDKDASFMTTSPTVITEVIVGSDEPVGGDNPLDED